MNPLGSPKCAGRLLMALATISSILLIAGCSSSSSGPAPNNSGFSNSSLTGTYVFSSSGADASGAPIALAGAFTANGSGGLTAGTMDVVDPAVGVAASLTISGSYEVGTDGRGQVSLTNSSVGTFVLDFVLSSTSHGLVTEFDSNGSGSGTLDLQSSVTSLAGNYAFSLSGADASGYPLASAGAITVSTGDAVTGVLDFNDYGTPVLGEAPTGSASLGSGTAPGTISMASNYGTLAFDLYPIDSTHWKLIETDDIEFLSGDVFSQPSTSITAGPYAFTMTGGTTVPVANGGVMTYNATNNTFAGSEDINDNGTVVPGVAFSGTAVAGGSLGGRLIVTLTDFSPATSWVVYPSSGGVLMLEADTANITVGAAYAQTAGATVAASQAYGFNLSAFNATSGYLENDIAQFTTTTSDTFSGIIDINDDFGEDGGIALALDKALGGTYIAPSSSGEGSAATTVSNSAYLSFNYYAVDSSTFLVLETDTSTGPIGAQIGTGTFEEQSAPQSQVMQSHIALAHPARPHGAFRRK
jgi:hypothetical protein